MVDIQDSVHTTLSSMGGRVCVDGRGDELILTGIADGTAVAGQWVQILTTIGATLGDLIEGDIQGNANMFVGILLPKYNTDCDTAVTNGEIVEYVVPRSGRRYNVAIADPSTGHTPGQTVGFHTTDDGNFDITAGDLEVVLYVCYTSKPPASTSRFCEVTWR